MNRPGFVGACEERVLVPQSDGVNGSLDGIGVDLDTPVIQVAIEFKPTGEAVAQCSCDW